MFEAESHLAAAFQQAGVSEALRPRRESMGGPAPPELVHIVEKWRIGPERGQGFEQQRPVALLPEHRRGKGLDRAVLVQEPRRRDRTDPRNARIAVGRVADEGERSEER